MCDSNIEQQMNTPHTILVDFRAIHVLTKPLPSNALLFGIATLACFDRRSNALVGSGVEEGVNWLVHTLQSTAGRRGAAEKRRSSGSHK